MPPKKGAGKGNKRVAKKPHTAAQSASKPRTNVEAAKGEIEVREDSSMNDQPSKKRKRGRPQKASEDHEEWEPADPAGTPQNKGKRQKLNPEQEESSANGAKGKRTIPPRAVKKKKQTANPSSHPPGRRPLASLVEYPQADAANQENECPPRQGGGSGRGSFNGPNISNSGYNAARRGIDPQPLLSGQAPGSGLSNAALEQCLLCPLHCPQDGDRGHGIPFRRPIGDMHGMHLIHLGHFDARFYNIWALAPPGSAPGALAGNAPGDDRQNLLPQQPAYTMEDYPQLFQPPQRPSYTFGYGLDDVWNYRQAQVAAQGRRLEEENFQIPFLDHPDPVHRYHDLVPSDNRIPEFWRDHPDPTPPPPAAANQGRVERGDRVQGRTNRATRAQTPRRPSVTPISPASSKVVKPESPARRENTGLAPAFEPMMRGAVRKSLSRPSARPPPRRPRRFSDIKRNPREPLENTSRPIERHRLQTQHGSANSSEPEPANPPARPTGRTGFSSVNNDNPLSITYGSRSRFSTRRPVQRTPVLGAPTIAEDSDNENDDDVLDPLPQDQPHPSVEHESGFLYGPAPPAPTIGFTEPARPRPPLAEIGETIGARIRRRRLTPRAETPEPEDSLSEKNERAKSLSRSGRDSNGTRSSEWEREEGQPSDL